MRVSSEQPFRSMTVIIYFITGVFTTDYSCDKYYVPQPEGGVITSDNYPFDYHNHQICKYRIYTGHLYPGEKVQIRFEFHRFETESIRGRCRDFLELDGSKYCGSGVSEADGALVWSHDFYTSPFKDVFSFSFTSDYVEAQAGFYATYQVIPLNNNTLLDEGSGENTFEEELCPPGFWRCFNRKCINSTEMCDHADNCGDNSDETYEHARCNFPETGNLETIACDFTYDNCAYSHAGSLVWTIVEKSELHQLGYGPATDHTSPNSVVRSSNFLVTAFEYQTQAVLTLDAILEADIDYCLTFWYHLSGFDAGKLKLYYTTLPESGPPDWSRDGNYSNTWQIGEVIFKSSNSGKQSFNFIAERGSIRLSSIALDDIYLHKGACLGMADVSCNFENDHACGWTLQTGWKILSNLSPSAIGLSMAFLSGANGTMISPFISKSTEHQYCLVFWMFASCRSGSCGLKIYLKNVESETDTIVFDEVVTEVSPFWVQYKVDIEHGIDEPKQIVIEGMKQPDSTIGLDAIEFIETPCVDIDLQTCDFSQFRCRTNRTCIPQIFVCDGRPDCPDGSDESLEVGCNGNCGPSEFKCYNDECIDINKHCDGNPDCEDSSDEFGCDGGALQDSVSFSIGAISGITVAIIMVFCLVGFRIGWCIMKGDFEEIGGLMCCCRRMHGTDDAVDEETCAPPPSYAECVNQEIECAQNEPSDMPPSYQTVRSQQYLEITHPIKSELDKLKRFSKTLQNTTNVETQPSSDEDSAIVCDDNEMYMEIEGTDVQNQDACAGPHHENYAFVGETPGDEMSDQISIPWKTNREQLQKIHTEENDSLSITVNPHAEQIYLCNNDGETSLRDGEDEPNISANRFTYSNPAFDETEV